MSLIVLGDDRADWRPNRYHEELRCCSNEFRFPIVKLLDYASDWHSLETSSNPFAVVVQAHLQARETQKDAPARLEWKFRIVRSLYERGLSRTDIRQLFRFIDWMLELPEPLALTFARDLANFEREKTMPYVTSIERHGIAKGLIAGIEQCLDIKFGSQGLELLNELREIDDVDKLDAILRAVKTSATVEELRALWS